MSAAPAPCNSCPLPGLCGEGQGLHSALLESVVEQRTLEAGAAVYRAGEKRCSIWVVATGTLKTCEVDIDGREQVVGFHMAGDVLGLERLEIPEHHGFALALEHSRVCRIPVSRLLDRLAKNPGLWREVLRIAGEHVLKAREMHRVLGQLQTGQRLAWFLLEGLGPRTATCACRGEPSIQLPMPRQDIASFLGMTLESVSRSFGVLQREGMIDVQGRRVCLLDPQRLAERITPQQRVAA